MMLRRRHPGVVFVTLLSALLAGGCIGRPNQANIALRKQIQAQDSRIAELQRQHDVDRAAIRALEQQSTTLPTLPQDRLDTLFVTAGLELGRLTGGADLDREKSGDEALKVYVVPLDRTGDQLKAAGSFQVELFDLALGGDNLIGKWNFTAEQARESWFGSALLYEYILTCPWQQRIPTHTDLTLTVTFFDELTQRQFQVQRVIQVKPPPSEPSQ